MPSRKLTGRGRRRRRRAARRPVPPARTLPTRSSTTCRTTSGPSRTSTASRRGRARRAGRRDGDVDAGGADVDAEEAQGARQLDDRAAAAAPRGGQAGRLGQAHLGEPVELDGELRPRQGHDVAELGAAGGTRVAQEPQERGLVAFSGRMATSHGVLLRRRRVTRITVLTERRVPSRHKGFSRDLRDFPLLDEVRDAVAAQRRRTSRTRAEGTGEPRRPPSPAGDRRPDVDGRAEPPPRAATRRAPLARGRASAGGRPARRRGW
jgi:hypothetical protein